MKDEIKSMLEFCDKDELVEDLSYPESLELSKAYSYEIRKEAEKKYSNVHEFINFCEEQIKLQNKIYRLQR